MTVCDAALGKIIGRKLQGYAVSRQNPDPVTAKLSSQVRKHGAFLFELNAKQAAGEFLNNGSVTSMQSSLLIVLHEQIIAHRVESSLAGSA